MEVSPPGRPKVKRGPLWGAGSHTQWATVGALLVHDQFGGVADGNLFDQFQR